MLIVFLKERVLIVAEDFQFSGRTLIAVENSYILVPMQTIVLEITKK